jgi:hypothetical protein
LVEEIDMNIEQMAIDAGVIVVEGDNTYWTENNAIEVLEQFAILVVRAYTIEVLSNKFK